MYTAVDVWVLPLFVVNVFALHIAESEEFHAVRVVHWSAMEFMGHWRQRLSVALGRGRARCLEAAAVVAATWDVDPASEHSRFGF